MKKLTIDAEPGQIAIDPARNQPACDPVTAPLLELPLVLDEQPREAIVVQIPALDQALDRPFDVPGGEALALEDGEHTLLACIQIGQGQSSSKRSRLSFGEPHDRRVDDMAVSGPAAPVLPHFGHYVGKGQWTGFADGIEFATGRLNTMQFLTIRGYLAIVFATLVGLLFALAVAP